MLILEMDWSDSGASVHVIGRDWPCPRCETVVKNGDTHLCGDRLPKPAKKAGKK